MHIWKDSLLYWPCLFLVLKAPTSSLPSSQVYTVMTNMMQVSATVVSQQVIVYQYMRIWNSTWKTDSKVQFHYSHMLVVLIWSFGQSSLPCTGCGSTCGVLTAASDTISDGSGSSNYADGARCQWIIAPTGATAIRITFTEFSTDRCCDFVRVYQCVNVTGETCEGVQLIGELSGYYSTGQTLMSSTGFMLVQFTSDSGTNYAGFTATWRSNDRLQATAQSSPRVIPLVWHPGHQYFSANAYWFAWLQFCNACFNECSCLHSIRNFWWLISLSWCVAEGISMPRMRIYMWCAHWFNRHNIRRLRIFQLCKQRNMPMDPFP